MGRTRVELWGQLVGPPELRVTPSGLPLLRLTLDCGAVDEELKLAVMMRGEAGRYFAAKLRIGQTLKVVGSLRAIWRAKGTGLRGRDLAIIASEIKPAA